MGQPKQTMAEFDKEISDMMDKLSIFKDDRQRSEEDYEHRIEVLDGRIEYLTEQLDNANHDEMEDEQAYKMRIADLEKDNAGLKHDIERMGREFGRLLAAHHKAVGSGIMIGGRVSHPADGC